MKEYSYKDIQKITEVSILFKNGFEILFEECRKEWALENRIIFDESYCVAKRNILAEIP